jgi:hypothetical protein
MIDVLTLDEADRMIEDGHFKEMKFILDFIYQKRVEYKKNRLHKLNGKPAMDEENLKKREDILKTAKNKKGKGEFVMKTLEKSKGVDLSNVVDLYNEDDMLDEIDPENLVVEEDKK